MNGIRHVGLGALPGHKILGCPGLAGHLMDQRNALGLSRHQHLGLGGQLFRQGTGTGLYNIGIAKDNKAGNGHVFIDGDDRQTAFDACHGDIIEFLHGNPPFPKKLGMTPLTYLL